MELARATPEEKEACLERVTVRQTVEGEVTQAALKQLQEGVFSIERSSQR